MTESNRPMTRRELRRLREAEALRAQQGAPEGQPAEPVSDEAGTPSRRPAPLGLDFPLDGPSFASPSAESTGQHRAVSDRPAAHAQAELPTEPRETTHEPSSEPASEPPVAAHEPSVELPPESAAPRETGVPEVEAAPELDPVPPPHQNEPVEPLAPEEGRSTSPSYPQEPRGARGRRRRAAEMNAEQGGRTAPRSEELSAALASEVPDDPQAVDLDELSRQRDEAVRRALREQHRDQHRDVLREEADVAAAPGRQSFADVLGLPPMVPAQEDDDAAPGWRGGFVAQESASEATDEDADAPASAEEPATEVLSVPPTPAEKASTNHASGGRPAPDREAQRRLENTGIIAPITQQVSVAVPASSGRPAADPVAAKRAHGLDPLHYRDAGVRRARAGTAIVIGSVIVAVAAIVLAFVL